jgi:hypothetical protein
MVTPVPCCLIVLKAKYCLFSTHENKHHLEKNPQSDVKVQNLTFLEITSPNY